MAEDRPTAAGGPTDEQVRAWYPRLFRTALRMTGSTEDAADLTQETFYKALRNWHRLDDGVLPTTWLHRILVNCVRDWARRRSVRRGRRLEQWIPSIAADEQHDAAEALRRGEQLELLRSAIEELPQGLRAAFAATVLDGYTYRQAAELLSIPVGTVASRVHQARRRVAEAMRRSFPET